MPQWPLGQAGSLKFTLKQNPVTLNISHHLAALHHSKAPSLFLQLCLSQHVIFPSSHPLIIISHSKLQAEWRRRGEGSEEPSAILLQSIATDTNYQVSSLALREPLEIFPLSHPGSPSPRLKNPGLVSGILLGLWNKVSKLHVKFLPTGKLSDSLFANILWRLCHLPGSPFWITP